MAFVSVAKVADVPTNTKKKVEAQGTMLLLANAAGKIHALADRCPHMGGSLSAGTMSGSTIKCPVHGSEFEISTGKNVGPAKIAFVKIKVKDAQSYRVEIRGPEIFVDIP